MIQQAHESAGIVPPEEIARRIAYARRVAYQAKSPPVVVYHPPMQLCPWSGCGYRIAGITFQLEKMVPPEEMGKWLAAWWLGPGLIGRCPGCHHLVLFDVQWKDTVEEPLTFHGPQLPDDWYLKARLAPQDGGGI
jgi:hypothetical protein